MKKVFNTKTLLIIAIVIAVIIFGGLATIVVGNAKTKGEVSKQLSLGDKFLEKLDYKQAILAYEKAINIDDKNVETYRKLAKAYKEDDQIENAINTLEKGYKVTGEESLKDMVRVYQEIASQDEEQEAVQNTLEPTAKPTIKPTSKEGPNDLAHKAYKKMMSDTTCKEFNKLNDGSYSGKYRIANNSLQNEDLNCDLKLGLCDITGDGIDELFVPLGFDLMMCFAIFTYQENEIKYLDEVRSMDLIWTGKNEWVNENMVFVAPFTKPKIGESMLYYHSKLNMLFSCYYAIDTAGYPILEGLQVNGNKLEEKYECYYGTYDPSTPYFYKIHPNQDDVSKQEYEAYKDKYFNDLGENIKFYYYEEFLKKY
ncbi:MAG: tetratricopeptide repeat protein [bacterium]|nr:tetratricopeptide repeat protein [bacterium]